jgi:hypothetical protein
MGNQIELSKIKKGNRVAQHLAEGHVDVLFRIGAA